MILLLISDLGGCCQPQQSRPSNEERIVKTSSVLVMVMSSLPNAS